jgi:hypothetical protein
MRKVIYADKQGEGIVLEPGESVNALISQVQVKVAGEVLTFCSYAQPCVAPAARLSHRRCYVLVWAGFTKMIIN